MDKEAIARKELFDRVNKVYTKSSGRVLLESCTGSGKCKIALDLIKPELEKGKPLDIVVPQSKIIQTWEEQIVEWGYSSYRDQIDIYCDRSLHKHKTVRNTIFDEAHMITPRITKFLKPKTYTTKLIALSATVDYSKRSMLKELSLNGHNSVAYSLDEGVEDNIVSPYQVMVVRVPMDGRNKNVHVKSGNGGFYITETANYKYIDDGLNKLRDDYDEAQLLKFKSASQRQDLRKKVEMAKLWRMKAIYNLRTKKLASELVLKMIPQDKKVLGFCSTIKQCEELFDHRYHSKTDSADFDAFTAGKINRLGAVTALNMGVNVPTVEIALVTQVQSKYIHLAQRAGRTLRKDPNDPDKKALLIVIVSEAEADMLWWAKASQYLDATRITSIHITDILGKTFEDVLKLL